MRDILTAQDAIAGAPVGGKARGLALASQAGLPVPAWVVLSPDAFWASLGADGRRRLEAATAGGEITALAAAVQPSPSVRASLARAFQALGGDGGHVAVRSSASDEDGAQHSFAGQLESVLHVDDARLPGAVGAVWHSGFSERILEYRRQHGLRLVPPAPAVLIQRMVDARAAGVAFSADPVSGRRGVAVVSAVAGLGTALVSGDSDADTFHVDRDGAVVERHIAEKRFQHRADALAPGGVSAEPVSGAGVSAPALTDDEVRAVAALARQAARHFGRAQDIEWAYEGGTLYLLQARPITSLASLADPDAELRLWDNSNIVESYSGVTTPLTFSFAAEIYEHVYRQFCRVMRVPGHAVAAHADAFRNMLGLVRGRLYYNLLNWYRVLALLPGFAVNRRFMEQMMGVREGLPEPLVRELESRGSGARLLDALHLCRTLAGLVGQHLLIDRRVAAFTRRLDAALAPPTPPLADRRPDELAAHYLELRRKLLLSWDAPLVNDFFAMIFYGQLRTLCARWCGDTEGTLQNDLVSGQGGLASAEPVVRLKRMATLAAGDPGLLELLPGAPAADILAAVAARPAFHAEYRAYLDRFGERSANELKLETETLLDDPLPLLRAVGTLARQELAGRDATASPAVTGDTLRVRAQARVAESLRWRPFRRVAFNWVLKHARARVRDRENLRLERTRLFGRVRRIFLELGSRLHELGVLAAPRDVFHLEVDEVLGFLDGRSTCTALGDLVSLRQREFRGYEDAPAPDDRFETRGPVYRGQSFQRPGPPPSGRGEARQGLGCCPGVVRGPVRVVTDPRFVDLGRRAVLVAENTDPGWIMIFPSALAVLVERGSLLSHAAIVARELGIPAVVSVPGLTAWLRDGDWVELDGSSGAVRRIDAPPGGETAGAE
jgi:pyruvate,water dikinase